MASSKNCSLPGCSLPVAAPPKDKSCNLPSRNLCSEHLEAFLTQYRNAGFEEEDRPRLIEFLHAGVTKFSLTGMSENVTVEAAVTVEEVEEDPIDPGDWVSDDPTVEAEEVIVTETSTEYEGVRLLLRSQGGARRWVALKKEHFKTDPLPVVFPAWFKEGIPIRQYGNAEGKGIEVVEYANRNGTRVERVELNCNGRIVLAASGVEALYERVLDLAVSGIGGWLIRLFDEAASRAVPTTPKT